MVLEYTVRVPVAGEATKRNEVLAAMKTLEGGDSAASTTVLTAVAAAAGKDRSVVAMTGHAPVAGDDASGTNGYVDVLFFGYYFFDIYCLDIIVLTMLIFWTTIIFWTKKQWPPWPQLDRRKRHGRGDDLVDVPVVGGARVVCGTVGGGGGGCLHGLVPVEQH